jgi:hypothetical protein
LRYRRSVVLYYNKPPAYAEDISAPVLPKWSYGTIGDGNGTMYIFGNFYPIPLGGFNYSMVAKYSIQSLFLLQLAYIRDIDVDQWMYFDMLEGVILNCAVIVDDMIYFAGILNIAGSLSVNNIVGCNLNGTCTDTLEGGLPNLQITQMVCIFESTTDCM